MSVTVTDTVLHCVRYNVYCTVRCTSTYVKRVLIVHSYGLFKLSIQYTDSIFVSLSIQAKESLTIYSKAKKSLDTRGLWALPTARIKKLPT